MKITELLNNPTRTKDWKTIYKALSYVIIGNKLFKKTPQVYTGPPCWKIVVSPLNDVKSVRNMEEYNMYPPVNYIQSLSHGHSGDGH